jgi:hypothetical protein
MVRRGVGGLFIALGVLIALRPSAVSPAGLTMGSTMNMHNSSMVMPGMTSSPAPMMGQVIYHATAGPYTLTLGIGPAERMLTPAEAKRTHARTGEVMLDGMMNAPMAMSGMQRHVEVHVFRRSMGMTMAVSNAHVQLQIRKPGGSTQTVSVMRMYGVKEGMKDLHYGANVSLSGGSYTVYVRVNGHPATFTVHTH